MQFTSIIATLSMVLAATALPSPNAPAPPTCAQGTTAACCTGTTGGLLLGGNCVLDVLTVLQCGILNGGQQACCQTTQDGLINVALPCVLA